MGHASHFIAWVCRFISLYHCNPVGICGRTKCTSHNAYAGESAAVGRSASTRLYMALGWSWAGRCRGGDSVRSGLVPESWNNSATVYNQRRE